MVVDVIVEFGNDIIQRTAAAVAEGGSAIHAACDLLMDVFVGQTKLDRLEVFDALNLGAVARLFALILQKSSFFAHDCGS
jgi:hypothetical protein